MEWGRQRLKTTDMDQYTSDCLGIAVEQSRLTEEELASVGKLLSCFYDAVCCELYRPARERPGYRPSDALHHEVIERLAKMEREVISRKNGTAPVNILGKAPEKNGR